VILVILFLIAVLPIKIRIKYDDSGILLALYIWLFKKQILPAEEKKKSSSKKKDKKPKPEKAEKSEKKKPELTDILELVKGMIPPVLDTLSRLRRKIKIETLKLYYTVASSDPYDTAMNYGKVSAGVGVIVPALEKAFRFGKKDIRTSVNFETDKSIIEADVLIVIRIWEIIYVIFGLIPVLKIFLSKNSKTQNREVDNYGQASSQ
jgi:hypothetical protein